jgi:hypothetical protein
MLLGIVPGVGSVLRLRFAVVLAAREDCGEVGMIWLKTPEVSFHCYQANGVSLCGMWQVTFAQPPPVVERVWSRSDRVCRGCRAREGMTTHYQQRRAG